MVPVNENETELVQERTKERPVVGRYAPGLTDIVYPVKFNGADATLDLEAGAPLPQQ